jgi:hypothetical protein
MPWQLKPKTSCQGVVLSINILLAGCGIPIAWSIVKANEPGSWQPHWQKLIEHLKGAIPAHWTVIMPAG